MSRHADQLDLFEDRPASVAKGQLVAFPLAALRSEVRALGAELASIHAYQDRWTHWNRRIAPMIRHLRRLGLSKRQIDQEIFAFREKVGNEQLRCIHMAIVRGDFGDAA